MKNVYDLLNEVQSDVQSYTIEQPNALELKRMKRTVKRCTGKRNSHKKLIGAACAAVILCGLAMTDAGSMAVYAAGESAAYHISNFMGLNRNLQDYATVIGTSQSDNGYTIRLNEVILDQESLVVSTNVYKDGATPEETQQLLEMGIPTGMVYVNGWPVLGGASGGAYRNENDNSVGSVIRYDLDGIDTSGELDIKLVFHNISLQEGCPTGTWKFHFMADGSALAADTVTIPVNHSFTLENGVTVTLTDYTSNVLGQRVYFTLEGGTATERSDYHLRLEGTDDLGQPIVFEVSRMNGKEGTGYMEWQLLGEKIAAETKSLTLTPYAVAFPKESGRMSNDYEAVGEPFTIDITAAQRTLAE